MHPTLQELTVERLHQLLVYDRETGIFVWRTSTCNRVGIGRRAGTLNHTGYVQITINGRKYQAHRIAWLYIYDKWPSADLDHINQDKTDNRIANLREVTCSENQQNTAKQARNTSGFKGVDWHARAKCWRARITLNGAQRFLGTYPSPEAASAAYEYAARQLHTHRPEV